MAKSRQAVVNLVKSWDGKKESNGSHKSIIDLYNDFFEEICSGKFPRGIRMRYDWAWCACTWSALAAALRYESIMPMEISCYYLIEAAKKMGCWQENDAYVPSPGDGILYDWQDNGIGDNTGNPDHVGTVSRYIRNPVTWLLKKATTVMPLRRERCLLTENLSAVSSRQSTMTTQLPPLN